MPALSRADIASRLDPELVGRFGATLPPHVPDGGLSVEAVREIDERVSVRPEETAEALSVVRPDGSLLEIRLHHQPSSHAILWIHGGGMFLGSARYDDALAQGLAETLGVSVASVDYRLAPEHPHPEPLDDCSIALAWLAARYDRVVVAGASAGGGLAAALALRTRDENGPAIAGVQLWYPMLDDRPTGSSIALADTEVWNRRLHDLAWNAYLGGADADPYAAPARATDLEGLPPHFIDVGDLDMFLDEDVDYSGRLAAAGVEVELHVVPGAVHASEAMNPAAAASRATTARRTTWLARILQTHLRENGTAA